MDSRIVMVRAIERSEYEDDVVANADRVKANWEKYRRRQSHCRTPIWHHKKKLGLYLHPPEGQRKSKRRVCTGLRLLQS
jgi:hypothetical protein